MPHPNPVAMRLKVRLALGSDNWIKGGPAGCDLELKRSDGNRAATVRERNDATTSAGPQPLADARGSVISGTRAFAAGYSGQCGAPALLAIADLITGGGKKIWAMQLPPVDRDGPDYKLIIEGNSFVIAYKDASLKATFISPPDVQITHAKGRMKAHPLSRIDDAEVNVIHASGADPATGDFLVVLTLQTGTAPAITVRDGAAQVGGQRVAFDGLKLTVD